MDGTTTRHRVEKSIAFSHITKGVKVSPDQLCFLTNSHDHVLRLFEFEKSLFGDSQNDQDAVIHAKEGGTVYDYTWYPHMSSADPSTCFFISTSQGHPVHLWNAYTGEMHASYRGYNHLDENISALSLTFNAAGDKILAGYDGEVRIFDTQRPGREYQVHKHSATRKSRHFSQRGIMSSLHSNPDYSQIYAAGSYSGSVCIYHEQDGGEEPLMCFANIHPGGVTQVQFSTNGQFLFTAGRKDTNIYQWDIRKTGKSLQTFERNARETNQRLEFDLYEDKYLVTGSQDSQAILYSLQSKGSYAINDCPDAVNGVAFVKNTTTTRAETEIDDPGATESESSASNSILCHVVLTTGQRHYELPNEDDEDDSVDAEPRHSPPVHRNMVQVVKVVEECRPLFHSIP